MILITRMVPFVNGLIAAGLLYSLSYWPSAIPFLTLSVACLVAVGIGRLAGFGKDLEGWWHVAITPVAFVVSAALFMLFLEPTYLLLLIPMVVGLFVFFFSEHLFRFVHLPGLYQPYALENTSLVLHVSTMYFLTTTFFGLQMFLQTPIWLLVIAFLFVAGALVYETLWVSKIRDVFAIRAAGVLGLILGETFLVVALLPVSFFVGGAVVATIFYVLLGMVRASSLQKLSDTVLRRYLLTGVVLLLILLLTAQWV
ncbi:hypothetical protein COV06_03945 [Candidatus Uhrbacteria bacterium CG10_big_fil_rev_8_21_14_0_10_50_16]|uniref:Uncharacterized protein n=1 Tax=Candidatus Uhrbacteria bacterium CG10_big_fil_rev_8_21_14_0_10_50_16 TaxID=1975039 RepID=A0A2H0RLN4_9BACT|nr:MAG: hypothetical protein COV06_03945 [Candidatus Uhrbacteria bacterium CG10_big_fil_rev_8_21_14_0_10_50_16]